MATMLQAGTHASVDDGTLTAYLERAMREEWRDARGEELPSSGPGAEDRRILFAAVAKGVLRYLYDHRADLITTREILDGTANHRHEADFDLAEKA